MFYVDVHFWYYNEDRDTDPFGRELPEPKTSGPFQSYEAAEKFAIGLSGRLGYNGPSRVVIRSEHREALEALD